MDRCDVLIVGGGPAGSTCARSLVRAGLDVLVQDARTFPREKPCAGWITPPVVTELELDLADYGRENVLQPFHGFRTSLMGREPASVDYGKPVSYGIRRCELDRFLLERSGARLLLGKPAASFERRAGRWIVNGEIETALVVGAGGHFCPVARFLGAEVGSGTPAVVAQEFEVPLDERARSSCRVDPLLPEIHFCEDLAGYGWCERKGDFLNVGLGRLDPRCLRAHVGAFVDFLKDRGTIPDGVPEPFSGHAYLLYDESSPRRVVGDAMLLVGDAAGLAYRRSGEGIRTAVESGLLAARAILSARGDYRDESLRPYVASLTERYANVDRARFPAVASLVPNRVARFFAAKLLSARWFSRRVVLDRWFFHVDQSALAA